MPYSRRLHAQPRLLFSTLIGLIHRLMDARYRNGSKTTWDGKGGGASAERINRNADRRPRIMLPDALQSSTAQHAPITGRAMHDVHPGRMRRPAPRSLGPTWPLDTSARNLGRLEGRDQRCSCCGDHGLYGSAGHSICHRVKSYLWYSATC